MNIFSYGAPEFKNIKAWINSKPLALKTMKDKVVLLDFWTYSCVNCLRTLPHIKMLHEKFADKGLVVIGMHTPEFEFEKDLINVKRAVLKLGIKYPVALDSDNTTWHLYGNQYWPRRTLIYNGKIILEQVGESGEKELEEKIVAALGISPLPSDEKTEIKITRITPEIYNGYERSAGFGNSAVCVPGSCVHFVDTEDGNHKQDTVYLSGDWIQEKERIRNAFDKPVYVLLKYTAKNVNAVLEPFHGNEYRVDVSFDGKPLNINNAGKDIHFDKKGSFVIVDRADMFELVKTKYVETHEVKLSSDSNEFALFTFAFG